MIHYLLKDINDKLHKIHCSGIGSLFSKCSYSYPWSSPYAQDVNWAYIRRSENVHDVFWASYVRSISVVSSGIWLQLSYFNINFLYVLQCPENSFRLCDVNSPWNIKAYSFVLSLNFALVLKHKSFSYQIVMPLTILWRLLVMPKKMLRNQKRILNPVKHLR